MYCHTYTMDLFLIKEHLLLYELSNKATSTGNMYASAQFLNTSNCILYVCNFEAGRIKSLPQGIRLIMS